MRLLSCHIENFGCFSDQSIDFSGNLCVFNEPNGWGKSTLAAFIKVMFYGFENEKKRGDTLERERVRFRPWQGGVYGGELVFEAGGKRYRLNRTFGKKEAEDTFALYDGTTNLPSGDYTSRIGEELFQINQESFRKTVFIAQNACDTAATDSINAKIGNLADSLDDLNQYEAVQEKIKDLRNRLTPLRKTGLLKQQKEKIALLKEELRRAGAMEQAAAGLEEKLAESLGERDRLQNEQRSLQTLWEKTAERQALRAKREQYSGILRQIEARKQAAEQQRAALGGRIPERETVDAMQEKRKELVRQESEAETARLSGGQKERLFLLRERFAEGVPDEEELRRGQELSAALTALREEAAREGLSGEERQEYLRLRERFGEVSADSDAADAPDRALELWRQYQDARSALEAKRADQNAREAAGQEPGTAQPTDKAGGMAFFFVVTAAALLLAGGALTAMKQVVAGVMFLAFGAAVLAAGLVRMSLENRKRRDRQAEQTARAERERETALLLEQEIARDGAALAEMREKLTAFLGRFAMEEPDWSREDRRFADELYTLRGDWKRFTRLQARDMDYQNKGYEDRMRTLWRQTAGILAPYCAEIDIDAKPAGGLDGYFAKLEKDRTEFAALEERIQKFERADTTAQDLRRELREFLGRHGQGTAEDVDEGLRQIVRSLQEYESDSRELDRLEGELAEFKASCDVSALTDDGEPEGDAEECRLRMERAQERMTQLFGQIHSYQTQLDEIQLELDHLQQQRENLETLTEEYEKTHSYYDHLGLTAEYLEKAKEELVAKYIGPVFESFGRYYEILAGESAEAFCMDADISVTRRALGGQRQIDAFSSGSRDLIYLGLRIALADAMYEGEKPFLILDDSFVNLDDGKLQLAERFLEEITEKYQVIYFTCHKSRAMGRQGVKV